MNIPMKKYGLAGLTLVVAALATILLVSLTAATASPAAPTTLVFGATISGTVSLPGGTLVLPVPDGTFVWLMTPDEWPPIVLDPVIHGRSKVVTSTGRFEFTNVPPGVYLVRAVPPVETDYTPSFIRALVVMTKPVNAGTLYLTNATITGTVNLPNGVTPAPGSTVRVYAGPVQVEVRPTRADGMFAIGGLNLATIP